MNTNFRKKLIEWCPQPKTAAPANPTWMLNHLKRPLLLVGIPVILLVAGVFLSLPFLLRNEADGWSYSREVDRINFSGGAIVVYENSQSPTDEVYVTIKMEANVTSEEDLTAYVDSRMTALSSLLETVSENTTIEAVITFKKPISPEGFARLCETTIQKPGEYAVVVTNETTSTRSSEVLCFPRPQEVGFAKNLTSTFEGYKLEGIIAFECYIRAGAAKSLLSNQEVLLTDPLEDLQILGLKREYETRGFDVQMNRSLFEEMWKQCVTLLK